MRLLWLALLLALATGAQAHRLNLFAMADGSVIDGYAYFPGGGRAADLSVQLLQAGAVLAEQRSDAQGRFHFPLAGLDGALELLAQSGDGHRARFPINLSGLPTAADPAAAAPSAGVEPTPGSACQLDPLTLEAAIAAQIRPLREQLDALSNQRRWQDILGGIGYILGLFGLAALIYTRPKP